MIAIIKGIGEYIHQYFFCDRIYCDEKELGEKYVDSGCEKGVSGMRSNTTLQLFLTFLKIGAFTFGGGYAMIPLIQKEVVENKKWLSDKDVSDVIAIAETTPGPIAINAATFVGYKANGTKGSLAATIGVVIPSFFIIVLIAIAFQRYMQYEIVSNAFWGLRLAVIVLMAKALITMIRQCPKNIVSYSVAFIALVLVGIFRINVLFVILGAALLGIIYYGIKTGKKV